MAAVSDSPSSRPRQVTLAAWLVIAASVLLVLSVFERLGDLHSLESRTAIERLVSEPPWSDLGLGVESALTFVRTVSMVAAGLATAAAILGYHALKRNRAARIGLTVLAIPLFLSGLVTGGFLASVVAASIAMLWLQPARGWFVPGSARPVAVRREAAPPGSTPPGPGSSGPGSSGPGSLGSGPPVSAMPPPVAPPQAPVGPGASPGAEPPPWAGYGAPRPTPVWPAYPVEPRRPHPLIAACAIIWVACALTMIVGLLLAFVLLVDADGLIAEMHRQNPALFEDGVTDSTVRAAGWIASTLCLVWSIVAGLLAAFAFRRARWGWVGLLASTAVVAVICLLGSLVSPSLVVPGGLAVLTVALLLRPGVQAWFSPKGARRDGMRA